MEILGVKDTVDSRLVVFLVSETEMGIANYVKLPLKNLYYCQEQYTWDFLIEDMEINDVFKGKWDGYVVRATPETIEILNTAKSHGLYWRPLRVFLLFFVCIECIFVLRVIEKSSKKREKNVGNKLR